MVCIPTDQLRWSTTPSYPGKPPAPGFSLVRDASVLLAEAEQLRWWSGLILEARGGVFLGEAGLGPQLTSGREQLKTAFLGCECTCLPVQRRPCLESSGTDKACLFQENPQISVSNMLIF